MLSQSNFVEGGQRDKWRGECPASRVDRGIDEVLHLRRKWQENAGFFNLRSQNLLELIFEPGVCIREQKNENDIFSNY